MEVLFLLCVFALFDQQLTACPQGCDCSDRLYVRCNSRSLLTVPRLKTIPKNAQGLHLYNNKITDIRIAVGVVHLPKVVWLGITYNHLTRIPAYKDSVLSAFTGLKNLILQNNKIRHIDSDAFIELHNLEVLVLSNNRLTKVVASWFDKLYSLTKLHLDNNSVSSFEPDDFAWPDKLSYLYLNNNRITTMPPLPIKDCSENINRCKITHVGLNGNDIHCGCRRPEHDKAILNMTLPGMSVCCVDLAEDCPPPMPQGQGIPNYVSKTFFVPYVEGPVCGKPSININPNVKWQDLFVVTGVPKPKIKCRYEIQDNHRKIFNIKMIKCDVKNKFGKASGTLRILTEKSFTITTPMIPLWSLITFCLLSFIPVLVMLAFVTDNCIKRDVFFEEDDDTDNISD